MSPEAILSKVTYHAVYDDSIMDALEYARTHGFAGVQLAAEVPHLNPARYRMEELRSIGRFRASNKQIISLHPPDHVLSLLDCNRVLPRAICGYYLDLVLYAQDLGASLAVLHLGTMPTFPTDTQPPDRYPRQSERIVYQALKDNLREVVNATAGKLTLAIENFGLEPPIMEIIEPMLGQGGLGLCWDLAKTYRGSVIDEAQEAFYWRNLRHVRQVHLHDIRDGQSHRVIGTGCVDFMRFLPRLAEAAVMEYTIEVRPREKAVESLESLKRILGACCGDSSGAHGF